MADATDQLPESDTDSLAGVSAGITDVVTPHEKQLSKNMDGVRSGEKPSANSDAETHSENRLIMNSCDEISGEKPLSKNQRKKMEKKRRMEVWKKAHRAAEKAKKREQRKIKKERGEDLGPSRKMLKHNKMADSACKVSVALDCSFDDLMSEKDINKLYKQIQHCYSINRRAENPMQLYITSLGSKTLQRMEEIGDYKGWDVNISNESYEEAFQRDNVVYLTSESDNVLQTLEPTKAYIIGGLVDHNHHKGLCYKLAVEKQIPHAQLPISQYLDMKSRKVLTIDHVFEILLRYTELKDWKEAFLKVIPQRKGAVGKSCDSDEQEENGEQLVEESGSVMNNSHSITANKGESNASTQEQTRNSESLPDTELS